MNKNIVFETDDFILEIGFDGCAKALIHKNSGRQCIVENNDLPLFTLTENRLFNNELKLAHPNKRCTFGSNRIRLEDGKLIVGFELLLFEAVVKVVNGGRYLSFELEDFIIHENAFEGLRMDAPPVAEFRLLQLPVNDLGNFGEWLNVNFDDEIAVNVLATSPYARIDAEKKKGHIIMTSDAVRGIKLKGCGTALIACQKDELLDAIEKLEDDFDLPKGVKSRRAKTINASTYWVNDATPKTIDEHIKYAKMGGFSMMLLYYTCVVYESFKYFHCGNYDLREEYENGYSDLEKMLKKIKDAGITPGLHVLQTHIGLKSRYCTPVADHRLNIKERFTLAQPLNEDDTVVYIEENLEFAPMYEGCRILSFGGEMISYEGYITEPPYRFIGCKRGYNDTIAKVHPIGQSGGVLDVSEFGASSVYLDQNSSLQDEIADKIAKIYNCGFEFMYFDGSEGTNIPFEFHVPNAQYRVYKKLSPEPLLSEGAAKSHFSWHMLSGGNAFDIFPTKIFKDMIVKYPVEEAPRMANDFTRVNFGWWAFFDDTQPDTYEFGTSRAFAWDCPATMQGILTRLRDNPRTADVMEVMRRWEYARKHGILTAEEKQQLKCHDKEHILLINESGGYELKEYERVERNDDITAYVFERNGRSCAVLSHNTGEGQLMLNVEKADIKYLSDLGGSEIETCECAEGLSLPVAGRRYLITNLSLTALKELLV